MFAQATLETVLGALPAGYLLLDLSRQVVFVSERFSIACHGRALPAAGRPLPATLLPQAVLQRLDQPDDKGLTLPADGLLLEWLVTPLQDGWLISVREDRHAFRTLVDNSPDIITRYDPDLRCRFINNTLRRFSPTPATEHIGRTLEERRLPAQLKDAIRHNALQVIASGKPQRFISELSLPQQLYVFESRLLPEFDDAGQLQSLLCIDRDISEQHATRQWEADENRLLEMIANDRPLPEVMGWTCQMIENQLSGTMCSIMLLDETGERLHLAAAPSLASEYKQAIDGLPIGEGVGSCGTAARRGEAVIVSDIAHDPLWQDYRELAAGNNLAACWSQPILAQDGKVLGTFAIYHDHPCTPKQHVLDIVRRTSHLMAIAIQQEQRATALYRLATQDGLTGLANRRHFLDLASQRLREASHHGKSFSLLMMDLDHFKRVNDNHGHDGGDVVLQAFAQCVKGTLRASDLVCRMGGEEFAAILPDTPAGEALVVAKRLRNAIAALPIAHQDHTIPITVSIGIASLSPACRELGELIRRADLALYQAKAKGRNRVCVAESL
ncbi:diguanylate cyclase [Vogesella fluminis]|uniref:diguanylate cyclase n=1 Tax=Vogesella fluminis TaxID=1069161 RepID=A0ABQ3H6G9_9NEIS|nr:diguanylate cyclase [Vogesella fluminis]GHD71161.1 hypothetical protein GCM10011419_02480 [Vogesella fluminis]